MRLFIAGVLVGVAIAAVNAHAMTVEETLVRTAAVQHGVDPDWLARVARCESSLNRYAVSPNGEYVGLFQLGRHGMLPTFVVWTRAQGLEPDPFSPSQQANFTSEMMSKGYSSAWSCA